MIENIILILLGVLAASSMIVKMKPEAKDLIDKIVPIQGWLGLVGFVLGIYYTVISLISGHFSIVYIAITLLMAALGLLMGFGLISKYMLSKNEEAMAKGEAIRSKLATFQIPLGIAGIVVGILSILRIL